MKAELAFGPGHVRLLVPGWGLSSPTFLHDLLPQHSLQFPAQVSPYRHHLHWPPYVNSNYPSSCHLHLLTCSSFFHSTLPPPDIQYICQFIHPVPPREPAPHVSRSLFCPVCCCSPSVVSAQLISVPGMNWTVKHSHRDQIPSLPFLLFCLEKLNNFINALNSAVFQKYHLSVKKL